MRKRHHLPCVWIHHRVFFWHAPFLHGGKRARDRIDARKFVRDCYDAGKKWWR
jgi:hypothetical protein